MNWHIVLAALSVVLEVASLVPYLRSMARGDTRPNAVSFGLWTALQAIAFTAQAAAGASWSLIVVGVLTGSTLLITILALTGAGYRKYGVVDAACLAFAIVAIAAWQATGDPVAAIVFAIAGDICAIVPTLVKTYREPHTEHAGAWGLVTLSTLLGALSTEKIDAANLAFPIYLTIGNGLIFALAYFGQKRTE